MKITTLAIILIIYGLGLYMWNRKTIWRINERTSKRIVQIHYLFAFFVGISIALNWIDNLSFSGQWTTRIIIIGFLVSGFLIYPLTQLPIRPKIEKYYFRFFSFLPTVTGVLLLIPFAGALMFNIFLGQLLNPLNKTYFNDDKLRVQSSYIGPMWPLGISVYQKKGVLERQLVRSPISDIFIDSVIVQQQRDTALIIFLDKTNKTQDTLEFKLE